MTEEELEAWEAALAIHKVAEELRKKKEAEEAARIAAGGEPVTVDQGLQGGRRMGQDRYLPQWGHGLAPFSS